MASSDDVKHLILKGVKISNRRGSCRRVFEADYNGTKCAAKQVRSERASSLLFYRDNEQAEQIRTQRFLHECLLHSKLDHPNIVKMLGVHYPSDRKVLPAVVMELMEYSLTTILEKSQDIPMYVKLSILQDVSRGVDYLHTLNPPVIHRNLNSNNILLTNNLVAKLCGFGSAQVVSQIWPLDIIDEIEFFIPRGTHEPRHGLPLDVFSFGCVICHVISQRWPVSSGQMFAPRPIITSLPQPSQTIPAVPNSPVHAYVLLEVDRRERYIDQISDRSLKRLVISCLNNDPEKRPPISLVCGRITSIITGHYSNDDSIKMAYSLAMKQGVAESRDLQVLLVGAENTGKTCLISSFLGEDFVEGQAATEAVEVDVCKIYCKDWTRISHSDKTNLLHHQFVDQLKEKAMDMMDTKMETLTLFTTSIKSVTLTVKNVDVPHRHEIFDQYKGRVLTSLKATDNVSPSSRLAVKSGSVTPTIGTVKRLSETRPQGIHDGSFSTSQYDPESLNLALWDFPGEIVPREDSPAPPECATIISSIHYWLQVVDSMCSVEGKKGDLSPLQPAVILAGTHIDLLHPDIKIAWKIAKEMILPQLIEELSDKHYAQHLVGMDEGIEAALEQFCFFISNKCRDEEIERLKNTTIKAAALLRKKQPIYFLKIERALLLRKEQVISKSKMVEVIAESTFPIAESSSEFEGVLRYFHDKRVILYFSQIESLKDLIILSPRWLARLFSYIITAHSYKRGKGFDEAWKRLTEYGILHESLLQHMLGKFHSDYINVVKVSKKQVVDILLCFHLVARITREAWFSEEGYPSLPDRGDTFIVPSLVPCDDGRNPPNTNQERIVYFKFVSGFIPTSLINQLIADCICRNVERNNRLLWMRHSKVGLQLGADQVYYISRCEEKKSIQLTITMPVRDDVKSCEERRELIDDITRILDDIMKVFMPAVKKRPVLLIPCPNCPTLHITLDEVCSGDTIFCTASGKADPLRGYYGDLLPHGSHDHTALPGADRKLEVFTKYYASLSSVLPIKSITSHFISAGVISFEDEEVIQQMSSSLARSTLVLRKIASSLQAGQTKSFDKLLFIMEEHGGMPCDDLANQMRVELVQDMAGRIPKAVYNIATQSSHDADTSGTLPSDTLSPGTLPSIATTSPKDEVTLAMDHNQDRGLHCCQRRCSIL
ncbi:uncharacterized protein [Dysidea avara]|uniref:uncharacterized protein isoform X2 n=1 Tax=Dysidea avara TaxID=196820 RepID=UPI00331B85A0